jgi:hypothetical protein
VEVSLAAVAAQHYRCVLAARRAIQIIIRKRHGSVEDLRQHSYLRVICYALVFTLSVIGLVSFRQHYPQVLARWFQKGTCFDMIGPSVLFVGACAGTIAARHRRTHRLPNHWAWMGYAALLGFLALEEIGWGFELFGFARPVVAGISTDSVHDLFRLVRRIPIRDLIVLAQLCAGVVIVGGIGMVATATGRRLLQKVSPSIAVLLLFAAGALFWATVFDVRIVDVFWFMRRNPAYDLEEGLELIAEVMLVLVVLDGWLSLPYARKQQPATTFAARVHECRAGRLGRPA